MKILHFDINGTLIPQDKVNMKDVRDGILSSIADDISIHGTTYKKYAESTYPNDKGMRLNMYRSDMFHHMTDIHIERYNDAYRTASRMYKDGTIVSLVPSFVQLIHYLNDTGEPFRLHLRTFGRDMHDILPLVESLLGDMYIIDMRDSTYSYDDLRNIFMEKNCAVIDDYEPWVAHNKHWMHGKIFPVEDSSYFFDDNIYNDIVCPMKDGYPIHPDNLRDIHLFQVSMVDILTDVNYFIDRIYPKGESL